jgi:hypothetical protein
LRRWLPWLLLAGAAARLGWLLAGLWRARGYRDAASPLYPEPECVRAAAAITGAKALFCISADVPGPVTFGLVHPVVLLPASFLGLPTEAQPGVASHELLHVRRGDWLVTLIEEAAGALLWFHPAIWWLLAQTSLAREEVVDAEIVRLTALRDSYVDALLQLARARPGMELAPAPSFLRRRHLTYRLHALLKDAGVSRRRVLLSGVCMFAALAAMGWLSAAEFPLTGTAIVRKIRLTHPVFVDPPPAQHSPTAGFPPGSTPAPAGTSTEIAEFAMPGELAGSAPSAASTPADRAAALDLLERARQNSDLHIAGTPPFHLEAEFHASGDANQSGYGQIAETWLSGREWRWTANFGAYSQARLGFGSSAYDEQPSAPMPLRVQMLRRLIFWPVRMPASASIRTSRGQWAGKPVTCVLTEGELGSTEPSRQSSEAEYCIYPDSGLLALESPAPGSYTAFGYSRNGQFHGHVIPDSITSVCAGVQVLDAHVAIRDAEEDSLPKPTAEMLGRGPALTASLAQRLILRLSNESGAPQTAVVHAAISPDGAVLEAELSGAPDPRLAGYALDAVRQSRFAPSFTQREAYIQVRFN